MINLKDVHLTLPSEAGPVNIIQGITLSVANGKALGLIGPSGSGKSTLMALIAGLEAPSRGEVIVKGKNLGQIGEDGLARFRRKNVGIVFQSFHLIPTMSALENVAMPIELAGESDAFERAEAALIEVGLKHRLSHYPSQLSGGEQQRVALARAVVNRPGLLLADEPTGNLDGATGRLIIDLIFKLHKGVKSTLILITHDRALAERCDGIVHLRDGQIDEGTTAKNDLL